MVLCTRLNVVSLRGAGQWGVKREGTLDVLSRHATRDEALDAARALALSARPSELTLLTETGKVERRFRFEPPPV